jgi:hypothetical protein
VKHKPVGMSGFVARITCALYVLVLVPTTVVFALALLLDHLCSFRTLSSKLLISLLFQQQKPPFIEEFFVLAAVLTSKIFERYRVRI